MVSQYLPFRTSFSISASVSDWPARSRCNDTRSIRACHASRDSVGSNSSLSIRRSPVGVATPELAPDTDPTPALGVPG
eukprot:9093557-Alexandrium_andersonii.AAC.1